MGPDEWMEAYESLCSDFGAESQLGVDCGTFQRLVEDVSEQNGCYCSDSEMQMILETIRGASPGNKDLRSMLASLTPPLESSVIDFLAVMWEEADDGNEARETLQETLEAHGVSQEDLRSFFDSLVKA